MVFLSVKLIKVVLIMNKKEKKKYAYRTLTLFVIFSPLLFGLYFYFLQLNNYFDILIQGDSDVVKKLYVYVEYDKATENGYKTQKEVIFDNGVKYKVKIPFPPEAGGGVKIFSIYDGRLKHIYDVDIMVIEGKPLLFYKEDHGRILVAFKHIFYDKAFVFDEMR
jgi:hypothetical protein